MTTHHSPETTTPPKLTWSSRIEVNSLVGGELDERAEALRAAAESRPRASRIEREIIWAVIVLYAAIIACFAGLHLLGAAQFGG